MAEEDEKLIAVRAANYRHELGVLNESEAILLDDHFRHLKGYAHLIEKRDHSEFKE